jgi:6-phosphogluconate dehydrogenase
MRLGLVGLGTMGGPMAGRLAKAGHEVVGADVSTVAIGRARETGIDVAGSLDDLAARLPAPRAVWVMVPPPVTGSVLDSLAPVLSGGDLVIDGGNSDWRLAAERAARLAESGVRFLDVGVSGGRSGWRHGYGLTVGGSELDAERIRPVLEALAAPGAVATVGPTGTGHFVKAVHNAVEYGLMQAYAEGFALLSARDGLDPLTALRVWQAGCSARSFLLDQTVEALAVDPALTEASTAVADSGMGRWTAEEAIRRGISTPVLTAALQARFTSRDDDRPANRLLVAARAWIGGHRHD